MKTICKIIGLQIALTAFLALGWWTVRDSRAACSAAVGGAVGFIPSMVYAWTIMRAGSPEMLLRAQYAGELRKLALTVLMFAAAFIWFKGVFVIALLSTYVATLAVYWVALLFPGEA